MYRTASLATGLLYLLTIVTSIPALALKAPALADPGAEGARTALQWAAVLEIALALACIGTAVAIYPALRSLHPTRALGFVAARTLEAGLVMLGVVAMLSVTAAREAALVAVHDWAFLLGPGLIPAVNAALLGSALHRARLVPRAIPVVGLIGAPLLAVSAGLTLFGLVPQVSPVAGLLALPIVLWELGLGLWLTFRGLRAHPVA
ncbi:hypothetical protein GCM10025789_06010 [Tessaracoccus lubricantis]|uniref:DUF4386 domain-containing protein n=1 Tax=Tessaracoccus lubricantis TaxID=545543 RepID=A0ABP9F3I1_9ACTN